VEALLCGRQLGFSHAGETAALWSLKASVRFMKES